MNKIFNNDQTELEIIGTLSFKEVRCSLKEISVIGLHYIRNLGQGG